MSVIDIFDNIFYSRRLEKELTQAFLEACQSGGTYVIEVKTITKDNTPRVITKKLEFEPCPSSLKVSGSNTVDVEFSSRLYNDLVAKHSWTTVSVYSVETDKIKIWENKQLLKPKKKRKSRNKL